MILKPHCSEQGILVSSAPKMFLGSLEICLAHLNEHIWEPLVPLLLPVTYICFKNSSKDNNQVLVV